MRMILGVLMIVGGIVLGLYVGLWVCFIGRIAGLIHAVQSMVDGNGVDGLMVAINIAKIMFSGLLGYISAAILILPGAAIGKGGNP